MTEIATIDWFERWGTSVSSENTAIFFIMIIIHLFCTESCFVFCFVLFCFVFLLFFSFFFFFFVPTFVSG